MEDLTLKDISIGMPFKSLNPIKRGDRIEFAKGSSFRVTEVVFNGTHDDEQRYKVTLQCTEVGDPRMALPVQMPKHQERSGYMRQLRVTLAGLNEQFEKLDDSE